MHRLPQRLKSTFFENFSSLRWLLWGRFIGKISKNVAFSKNRKGKQCKAKQLSKEDLEFLEKNTKYDEAEIRE